MRTWVVLLTFAVAAGNGLAQCHKIGEVNAEKPEGQLLQQIGQEPDAAKKLALMEQFVGQYQQHEAAGWVYEQMLASYSKAGDAGKAIAIGEKLAAMPGDCVEAAQQTLKAAETTKDPELIKKWSNTTSELARKVVASPQPKEEEEVAIWKQRVDYAKQVDIYTEYSLMAAALAATDPAKKVDLVETLEKRNPESQYLAQLREQQFLAYRQLNQPAKAVELTDRLAAKNAADEEMLLVAADYCFNNKQPAKALEYAEKTISVANAKPKPANVADADWEKRKNAFLGRAQWMAGMTYMGQGKMADGEKALTQALPHIRDTQALLAPALFNLGLANYKLGDKGANSERILAAVRYFEECARIRSPFQAQAQTNLKVIRSKYSIK